MAYIEENYTEEYSEAYETVLSRSMESLTTGNDTPLEKLFDIIDASDDIDVSTRDKLSLKKDAYMQLLSNVTAQSQQTAMAVVEKKFRMHNELTLLENQVAMSNIDKDNKYANVVADLAQKTKMLEQVQADIDFNTSKKLIMESTRKDNIRIKATEQYAEFLKYISAADVVPAKGHFDNIVGLVTSINTGISDPDEAYTMIAVSGADTEKKPT